MSVLNHEIQQQYILHFQFEKDWSLHEVWKFYNL